MSRYTAGMSLPTPLVFLPGAGGRASFWAPVAARLEGLGPTVRLGYPGFGEEPATPEVRSLEELHRWVLERLPAGPCHVVAQSMGGVLAVRLALEAPERVASLTLVATSGGIDVAALGGSDWRAAFRAEHPDFPDWFERDRTDFSARLGAIRAPTLVLSTDVDPLCPPAVPAFLAARIPGARATVVRGGTHSFAHEKPDEVAAAIREHVRGVEGAGAAARGAPPGGWRGVETLRLDGDRGVLRIVDQTLLPGAVRELELGTKEEVWEAIRELRVRGAPAIGVAAAAGLWLAVRDSTAATWAALAEEARAAKRYLASARPTAVNLFWALDRMERRLHAEEGRPPAAVKAALRAEAEAIRDEDEDVCRRLGEHGLTLLAPGMGLLTHCNAGALATARFGTALAPIYLGAERGYDFRVYADETRPLLQGARLTAWELQAAGIDVTLLCDNMASFLLRQGKVQAVLVGCDRVAANGDVANKIGTSGVAILARHYGVPFYVVAPLSTVDLACPGGAEIHIEERPAEEVTEKWYAQRMAPAGVKVLNPAFDVTDAALVSAIVTERGVVQPPYEEGLRRVMSRSS
jgi:methylthioribose-1-phosphate isomerase